MYELCPLKSRGSRKIRKWNCILFSRTHHSHWRNASARAISLPSTRLWNRCSAGGQGSRDLSASGISFILRAGGGRRAIGKAMILFITSSANGPQCAESLHAAPARKRNGPRPCRKAPPACAKAPPSSSTGFLLETEPDESDQMLEHLGTAFPVYVNFAVTGMERLVREVRSALQSPQARGRRSPPCGRRTCKAKCGRLLLPCSCPANLQCLCLMFLTLPWKRSAPSITWCGNPGSVWNRTETSASRRVVFLRYCVSPHSPLTFRFSSFLWTWGPGKV
jgi:hypothetical protein